MTDGRIAAIGRIGTSHSTCWCDDLMHLNDGILLSAGGGLTGHAQIPRITSSLKLAPSRSRMSVINIRLAR